MSLLEHVSPIGWDNILLYGEYVIDTETIPPTPAPRQAVSDTGDGLRPWREVDMVIGGLGILGIVVITGVLLGCLVPLAALAVALVVLVLQQKEE